MNTKCTRNFKNLCRSGWYEFYLNFYLLALLAQGNCNQCGGDGEGSGSTIWGQRLPNYSETFANICQTSGRCMPQVVSCLLAHLLRYGMPCFWRGWFLQHTFEKNNPKTRSDLDLFAVIPSSSSFGHGPRFQEHGLSLPVPISWIPLGTTPEDGTEFPTIKVSDMVQHLCASGSLNKLFGGEPEETIQMTLLEFWRRYSYEVPGHEVFTASSQGEITLQRSIPYMVHGDEGRCFKRKGIMLLTVQGVIGKGTRPFINRFLDPSSKKKRMGVNIGGHSFESRILFAAMQRKTYATRPDPCCI